MKDIYFKELTTTALGRGPFSAREFLANLLINLRNRQGRTPFSPVVDQQEQGEVKFQRPIDEKLQILPHLLQPRL